MRLGASRVGSNKEEDREISRPEDEMTELGKNYEASRRRAVQEESTTDPGRQSQRRSALIFK